ncbi:DUF2339 domain-containing protein [uncultured Enterovirga sp.]|uniref:DUF2339 domain-containing protein n=1 Tax=uncultured Enterovirga sp. TaxID=2026352 RepID=UPI0035C9B6F7
MFELFVLVGGLATILLVGRRFTQLEARIVQLETFAHGAAFGQPAAVSSQWGLPVEPPSPAGEPPVEAQLPPVSVAPLEPPAALPPARPATLPPVVGATSPAPATGGGFEEALGSRWAVWVGGLALGLGGIFLVRYSIEQDLIGPGLRVFFGLLFAAGLMSSGEWLRRREEPLALPVAAHANVPAILTAAGTSTAFASIYAAYGLYGLIGPALAFVALGAVALVTMAAALLHGPALAALGLVAALAAPVLVESTDPSPISLVLYLVFAVGAAYGVARLRLWRWLAISASAGACLWGVLLVFEGAAWQVAAMAHVLVQLALAILFLALDPHRDTYSAAARTDRLVAFVLFAFAVLAVGATVDLGAGLARPAFIAAIVLLLLGAAWRVPSAASGAAAAALAVVGLLALWPVASEAAREPLTIIRDLASSPRPEALTAYLTAAFLLNALLFVGGLGRVALGRDLRPALAGWYVGAAILGPLASLVVAYWRVTAFDRSIPFALAAGALGALYAASAGWSRKQDPEELSPALRLAVGATASAAVAALAAGLTFAFDRGILTVALSLSALATAVIAERTRLVALRYVVGALAIAVAARLAWDPSIMRGEIGRTPILNWLLWGYGVPALSFALSAYILGRSGRDRIVRFTESLGILFAALLIFLEIRHALHAGNPFAARSSHLEAGLVVTEALGFTLLMTRLDLRSPDSVYRIASLIFGAISLLGAAVALGVVHNPYLSGETVFGGAVFNSLLPAYLIPAGMAAGVAVAAQWNRPRAFVLAAAGLALLLELAYAFLEVRMRFQGPKVSFFRATSQSELWCYSLVLLANGIALLALGFLRDWRVARQASLGCIVLAVLKVFLIDMSALEGLTRAFSFVGLGLALVLIGMMYQRVLSARSVGPRV